MFEQRLVFAARPPNVNVMAFIIADLPPRIDSLFERQSNEFLTAVVANDHVEIFVEIKFEKCVTHEVFHADSKNCTGIFV